MFMNSALDKKKLFKSIGSNLLKENEEHKKEEEKGPLQP